jgi:hypothetical protein
METTQSNVVALQVATEKTLGTVNLVTLREERIQWNVYICDWPNARSIIVHDTTGDGLPRVQVSMPIGVYNGDVLDSVPAHGDPKTVARAAVQFHLSRVPLDPTDDGYDGDLIPDDALERQFGQDRPLEPTPDGSKLEHWGSMIHPCKIHSFAIRADGPNYAWLHVRIMRVAFQNEGGENVGVFFSQIGGNDWVEVPPTRFGSLAPDTVSAHRDVAQWVLSRPGGPLAKEGP